MEDTVITAPIKNLRLSVPPPTLPVGAELELVERRLARLIESREGRLTEIASYLIASGGKRVRPAVALLAYRASGGDDEHLNDIVDVAAALELIHSASLLHDDIIDGSLMRRGRDSALRKFGTAQTLVSGDFLFGLAYRLCARFDEQLINWAVNACISLTEGEMMQGRFRRNPAVTPADYVEIVTRKTASLFEAGARIAAYLARADETIREALAAAALNVGLTFQMIDDVLDITGAQPEIGKPVGLDVREGNPSLPVVLALQHDSEIRHMFARETLSEGEVSALVGRLRRSTALTEARRLAAGHAVLAKESLRRIPESPYRDHLLWLIDQLVGRVA